MRKMEAASLIANFAIDELLVRASRANEVRNYYDIAVVGYSGDGVEMIIGDENDSLTDIKSLMERRPQPRRYNIIQQDTDGNMVSAPITLHEWVEPKACGSSPMYEALIQVKRLIADWCDNPHHRYCFPPLVINISDGGCSDAEYDELIDIAKDISRFNYKKVYVVANLPYYITTPIISKVIDEITTFSWKASTPLANKAQVS